MNKKTVLFINLKNREFELKYLNAYWEYIGGIGLGLKALKDNLNLNPLIITVGPLSGLFPYTSKSCLLRYDQDKRRIEEVYAGGSLSFVMRLLGLDGILIYGNSAKPIVLDVGYGKVDFIEETSLSDDNYSQLGTGIKSTLLLDKKEVKVDGFFSSGFLKTDVGNLKGMVVSGNGEVKITNPHDYDDLVKKLTQDKNKLTVGFGNYPSCFGCPASCEFSKEGEEGNSAILPKCLIACQFSENLYRDPTIVFSCLSVLGVPYHHEHLEAISQMVGELKKDIEKK